MSPEECIVIEDSDAGILAASRAGMKGINVPDMKKPDENMKKNAYKIFNNLIEVRDFFDKI